MGSREEDLRKARKLADHVVICGYTRNIKWFLRGLAELDVPVGLVADLPRRPPDLPRGVAFVRVNTADDEVLLKVNVPAARVAVVALEDDSRALLTILTLRALNAGINITCNFLDFENLQHFERVGTDSVFSSQQLCGEELAHTFLNVVQEGVPYESRVLVCGWNSRTSFLLSLLDPTLFQYALVTPDLVPPGAVYPEIEVHEGSPVDETVLRAAGLADCRVAIVSLEDDSKALQAVLTIESADPEIVTICDLREAGNLVHLQRVGVDHAFSEEKLGGAELLHYVRLGLKA